MNGIKITLKNTENIKAMENRVVAAQKYLKEINNMKSKLEKDERGFWHYTSANGIIYDVDEASTEVNVITDVFQEFWDEETIFHYKLIDFCYGNMEGNVDDIKEFFDDRIDFYEKHERTIKFLGHGKDDNLYKAYLGTEEPKEWNEGKKISVDEMNRMLRKEQPLSKIQSEAFLQNVWYGRRKDFFCEMANEVANKIYELKYDGKYNWMGIGKLESVEDYISAWENCNWYLYYTMDELIQDEYERGGFEEDDTLADCAKQCYEELGHTIFKLQHCVIQYYR